MRRTLLTLLALALIVVACNPPQTGGSNKAVTGTLGPEGGVVTGPDGVAIGAPRGFLEVELEVTLDRADDAEQRLPSLVTPHGHAYSVSATSDVYATDTLQGFVVAIPVPDGVATDDLAVAVYPVDPSFEDTLGQEWIVVEGRFDQERGVVLIRAPSVSRAGDLFRLVSGGGYASPVATPPPADPADRALATQATWAGGFDVRLRGICALGPCPPAGAEGIFEVILTGALNRYKSSGFKPFSLNIAGLDLWLSPAYVGGPPGLLEYVVEVKAEELCSFPDEGKYLGLYNGLTESITLCSPTDLAAFTASTIDELTGTAYHELFHSLQRSYHGPFEMKQNDYFTEGTAETAESFRSGDTVQDSGDFSRRDIDIALESTSGKNEYRVQDFWVDVANRAGLDFAPYMIELLEGPGLAPDKLDSVFSGSSIGSSFADEYSEWVQTQGYDLSGCTLNSSEVISNTPLGSLTLTAANATGSVPQLTASVTALNTKVFEFTVTDSDGSSDTRAAVVFDGDWRQSDSSTDHAIVLIDAPAGGSCRTRSGSILMVEPNFGYVRLSGQDATTTYNVFLANGDDTDTQSGDVWLDAAPFLTADPAASPSGLIADNETDVTFTLPFSDVGANIAKIHGTFEFENSSDVFNLTWEHDEEFVSGFTDQASGSGTIEVAIVVYCSERGSNTVTATWQLEDELGFKGEKKSTDMNVSFGGCVALHDDVPAQPIALKVGGNER